MKSDLMRPFELKIIWEYSNDNTHDGYRLMVYSVSFGTNEKTKKIHTIIITRDDHNLSTSTTRKFKIQETNQKDIDILVATIKKEIHFKKADPIPTLIK
ncbi:hypothetical protein GTQ43_07700 [Nostoc sp. KVJ3]|uniref:hypothetical protein n=1 Tax=Nostoc sp. KVJ3 TaxID=457945 RepID=UPI0022371994|nr:hypothetical protein [Nostoc sp. KVJ3]MCW5313694.1 hypothetical protein [Nostoc sp. KVJ3]